jgi:hypothetical protein
MRATGGIPRLINNICDSALLSAYAQGEKSIDADIIREVASELHLIEPDAQDEVRVTAGHDSSPRWRWLGNLFR